MSWTVGIIVYIVIIFVVGVIVGRAIRYTNSDD